MNRLIHMLFSSGFLFLLIGCVGNEVDHLPTTTKLKTITRASDLAGVYKNRGRTARGDEEPLLTDFLMDGVTFRAAPEAVRFRAVGDADLRCEVLLQGVVLQTRDLVHGKDFKLADGALSISNPLIEPVMGLAGTGFGSCSVRVRLTEHRDLVVRSDSKGAGLMLYVWPIAVMNSQDIVFERN